MEHVRGRRGGKDQYERKGPDDYLGAQFCLRQFDNRTVCDSLRPKQWGRELRTRESGCGCYGCAARPQVCLIPLAPLPFLCSMSPAYSVASKDITYSSTDSSTSSSSSSSSHAGPIAGGVVGGIVGLAAIAALIFFLRRRQRNGGRGPVTLDTTAYSGPIMTPFEMTQAPYHDSDQTDVASRPTTGKGSIVPTQTALSTPPGAYNSASYPLMPVPVTSSDGRSRSASGSAYFSSTPSESALGSGSGSGQTGTGSIVTSQMDAAARKRAEAGLPPLTLHGAMSPTSEAGSSGLSMGMYTTGRPDSTHAPSGSTSQPADASAQDEGLRTEVERLRREMEHIRAQTELPPMYSD